MTENKNTIVELAKSIGRKALWTVDIRKSKGRFETIKFEVEIKDVEMFYGVPHYTITPVAGSGQARVRDGLEIS